MLKKRLLIVAVVILGVLPSIRGATAQSAEDWQAISPGGDTTCSNGTPYTFYARDGASDKLLIFFQGGGACWDNGTCVHRPSFHAELTPQDDPGALPTGVFDLTNPENPFKDYDMVVVSYCTGDVHTGNAVKTYQADDGKPVEIQHKGYVNAQSALSWAYDHFADPQSVFIMGCSAGSPGSIFHTPDIIDHYGADRITAQLGDAGSGFQGNFQELFDAWGTLNNLPQSISDLPANPTLVTISEAVMKQYPDVTFAQYDSANDVIQSAFLILLGSSTPVSKTIEDNLNEMSTAAPSLRTYVAGGNHHCITDTPDMYTYTVGSNRFVDWLAALANDQPVENVTCTDCTRAEEVGP